MHCKNLAFLSRIARLCCRAGLGVGLLLLPAVAAAAEEETEEFFKSSLGFYQAEDTCVFGAIRASGGDPVDALEACNEQFAAHKAHLEEVYNNRAVRVFMHFRKLDALDKAEARYRSGQSE